ncbi:MAG: HAD family hydrolase [Calditrichota bacterium]
MKLLIFDIDGTLTHLDGATRSAFDAAYMKAFGCHAVTAPLKMHGRTDPLIFRDCYQLSGLNGDWQADYEKFRAAYISVLPEYIASRGPNAHLHPGISDLLRRLADMPDQAALALGTGNMEAGGRAKVGYFDLNHYFPVGGFGDIHHERSAILRDAVTNAERHWNRSFPPADTWVIGDTPYDVEGGKALGLRTLAVATGGAFSLEELINTHPDAVFNDLSDTEMVLHVFGL